MTSGVFESCITVLSTNGELLITLCKGKQVYKTMRYFAVGVMGGVDLGCECERDGVGCRDSKLHKMAYIPIFQKAVFSFRSLSKLEK